MSNIDQYLPAALGFWNEQLQALHPGKSLPKQYKGYVASFGVAVIHCGLLPAVFMFSRSSDNSNSDEDKSFIVNGVMHILKAANPNIAQQDLFEYVLSNDNHITEKKVCDAAIALKLALRTFKLSDHA